MTTRTVLVTGRGGSGATTVAAATAVHSARHGLRTLLLAAHDPHRTMDALLGVRLGEAPAPVGDGDAGPHAARIDEERSFQEGALHLAGRVKPAFDLLGVDPLDPEELTALPGTRHLVLLRALCEHTASGHWDLLVVDGPPVPELVAALALPERLDRYLARLLPEQRQAARALRPVLAALAGVPMPADWLFEARSWAAGRLAEARRVVEAPQTSVRLVVDADGHTLPEVRRARAGLALFEHRVDAVVASRALPVTAADSPDPWLAALAAEGRTRTAALASEFAGEAPLLPAPHLGRAPDGPADLAELGAALYGSAADLDPPHPEPWAVDDRLAEDGLLVWRLPLPGAERADLDLVRRGDELIIGIGAYRRIARLPSALRRCTVSGAGLRDGLLSVRFTPDPALWPQR
ncbi:ArsA family ATPase [Peterkaempfera bronchialis]|uniref:ArsA family ATPase n=1 Tax=Peterkaempfera bronchialis TaxID=2126346 RepID=A0A345STS6_9ACTN|nr:ArsA-related P-loop ATPase [Peterkaempfera bronchialis]AXI77131.1 ArsA family ATPase [Peterkaempfera bronchialis]